MNKDWKNVIIFLLIIFFITWIFSPSEDYDFNNTDYQDEESQDNFSEIDELHWNHMPITYSFSESCVGPIVPRIEWAFQIIENNTNKLVNFNEIENNGDITFICYPEQNKEAVGYDLTEYTFGQSAPNIDGSVIKDAEIEFWSVTENTRPTSCSNFPRLEIHEILHAFGFDHILNNTYTIMHPYGGSSCIARDDTITYNGKTFMPEDKIDEEIVSCLKYIYSNGQIGLCNKYVKFMTGECPLGYYEVPGSRYCCPEPNMRIDEEGYCV